MALINTKHLSVNYHFKGQTIPVLSDITLDLAEGGIYTIIGPSGSGKSTFLKVLAGIIGDYTGEVFINGRRPDPQLHSIGYIPQNYGLLPWKRVYENILLAAKIKKIKPDSDYVTDIIQSLELTDLLSRFPSELSGGQQQRVALARSFIQKPELLLMDEPFSALDTLTAGKTRKLFLDIWKRHKVTTLFVTHSIEEAVKVGKYIILFSKAPGKIIRVLENPLMTSGALRDEEAYFRESQKIYTIIREEWL